MIAHLRRDFLSRWTPAGYRTFLEILRQRCGVDVPFRLSETPCFLPRSLVERLDRYSRELFSQLSTPQYRKASERSIPHAFRVPAETAHPNFIQADFGILREPYGSIGARLI